MLPVLLAILALPSVVAMIEASVAVLDGQTADWVTALVDLCRGMVTVAVALVLLRMADRSPTMPLWLLDRRVLARIRRVPE